MTANRRAFLTGLTGFVACAPAIVRAGSLMKLPRPPRLLTLADWAAMNRNSQEMQAMAAIITDTNRILADLMWMDTRPGAINYGPPWRLL